MFKTNFLSTTKFWEAQERFGGNCNRMPHRVCGPGHNRCQKVFHWGPSCLCRGARHLNDLFVAQDVFRNAGTVLS